MKFKAGDRVYIYRITDDVQLHVDYCTEFFIGKEATVKAIHPTGDYPYDLCVKCNERELLIRVTENEIEPVFNLELDMKELV